MAVWPVAADLRSWVRSEQVTETNPAMLDLSFDAASELLRDYIDADLLICKAGKAGIVTDDTDVAFDQAALDAWCPSYVHTAILIRAAALYTRRDSANGTISFAEFATKVSKMDPDVEEMMAPVHGYGVA